MTTAQHHPSNNGKTKMEIERACMVKVKIYLKSEQPEAIEICYVQLPACLQISRFTLHANMYY